MSSLFEAGSFTLHSGAHSKWKIECDGLTVNDWEALALMVAERVEPFSEVVGVPRGGIPLAKALEPFATPKAFRILVVDDVLTTGRSMDEIRESVGVNGHSISGAVVFARGECPDWIAPLFQMSPQNG